MTLTVRHYRNTDAAEICTVWNSHHELLGPFLPLTPMHLEIFVLAKQYFDAQNLLLVENESRVEGFIQLAQTSIDGLEDQATKISASSICIRPSEDEEQVAAKLIEAACERAQALGASSCDFKPPLPHASFFVGLGIGDSMVGLTTLEGRTEQWLRAAGFEPITPVSQWELDLGNFQPPVDRQLIQIRRSAQVSRQIDEPNLAWWQACLLGHTEPTAFHLLHRTEGRLLADVLFWTLATELVTTPESVAWLWPPQLPEQDEEKAQLLFLLCEAIRELQSERVDTVRCVSAAQDDELIELLRKVGFRSSLSGFQLSKSL